MSDLPVLPAAGGVRMDSLENPRAVAYALNFSSTSALNLLVRPTAKLQAMRTNQKNTNTLPRCFKWEIHAVVNLRLTVKRHLCELLVDLLVFEDQRIFSIVRLHHSNILHPSMTCRWTVQIWTGVSLSLCLIWFC